MEFLIYSIYLTSSEVNDTNIIILYMEYSYWEGVGYDTGREVQNNQ